MPFFLGIDLILIELELKIWLEAGLMFSVLDWVGHFLPNFLQIPWTLGRWALLVVGFVCHWGQNFTPPYLRRALVRARVPPILVIPWDFVPERPPLIDILTKIVLEVGLIWLSWNFEVISGTLSLPYYAPRVEPLLRHLIWSGDTFERGCLIINLLLAIETIIAMARNGRWELIG